VTPGGDSSSDRNGTERFRWLADRAVPVGATLGLLALWETAARTSILPTEFPPFTEVVGWLAGQVLGGSFWRPVGDTVTHWFGGLVIGGVPGIILGVVLGLVSPLERLLRIPLEFLRPIPSIVYLPLLILVLGSRSQTAIVLAAVGAFWPMLFQTFYGVRSVDMHGVETGRVFGLGSRQILWNITLPSVLPHVAVGLRIASSLALVVAISAELVGGVPGLGTEILGATQNGLYDAAYGLVIVVGVLGLLLNTALEQTEKRLLRWHVPHRVVEL